MDEFQLLTNPNNKKGLTLLILDLKYQIIRKTDGKIQKQLIKFIKRHKMKQVVCLLYSITVFFYI